ncbi:transporter [Beijerinckia indica]|nr:transporter [Beijerinckia indica]
MGAGHVLAAEKDAEPSVDKSQYNLFNPTPESAMRGFAPNRPSRGNTPITVDAGHFQYETDLYNYTESRGQSQTVRTGVATDPVLIFGLTNQMDFWVGVGGLVNQWTRDWSNGPAQTTRGTSYGDTVLSIRYNLIGNDGGDFALGLIPYVKIPTATRDAGGNRLVEGGIDIPMQVSLPGDFSMGFMTELDILVNNNDSRRHAAFTNIINFSHAVPFIDKLTATLEFFSSVSADKGTPNIFTADFCFGYLVTDTLQLDAATYIGLNKDTPTFQVYAGISQRF